MDIFSIPAWATPELKAQWGARMPPIQKRFQLVKEGAAHAMAVSLPQYEAGAELLFKQGLLETLDPESLGQMAEWLGSKTSAVAPFDWAGAEPILDTRFTTTSDWELFRSVGIGGSDVAAVLGLSPFRGAQQVWLDKTVGGADKGADADTRFIFAMGHAVEDVCIQRFCDIFGAVRCPEYRMLRSKRWPELTANVDGILMMPNGKLAVFEAKTANPRKRKAWVQGPPAYYVTQCRQYMAVLDDPRLEGTYIGCVFSNNPKEAVFHFIPRDKAEEDRQCEAVHKWWTTYVLGGVKPPISGNPRIDKEVVDDAPLDEGTVIDRPDLEKVAELYMSAEAYRRQKAAELKKAVDYRDEVLFYLHSQMGRASHASAGNFAIRVSEHKGKISVDANRLKREFPDAYEKCAKRGRPSKEIVVSETNEADE